VTRLERTRPRRAVARDRSTQLVAACECVARMKCLLCEDTGWVCENHLDQPWEGPHTCSCGGAGMPCAKCNPSSEDKPPRLPKGSSPTQSSASRLKTTGRNAYIRTMPSKHIELPPRVAQTFVRDMRAFFKAKNQLRQDEIAARRLHALWPFSARGRRSCGLRT
jgi:hypothetical protein